MSHHLTPMRCPPGYVVCAACDECAAYAHATRVHRGWSRRFPWRVYRGGDPPPRRWRPSWLYEPIYLCPAHTALVEGASAAT